MTVTAPAPPPLRQRPTAQLLTPEHRPSRQGWVVHIAVSVLAVLGALTLWNDLAPRWRTTAVAIVATIVAIRVLPLGRRLGKVGTRLEYVGALMGLVVIPLFALLGADAAFAHLGVDRFAPLIGVLVGGLLFCLFARASLEPLWTAHRFPRPWAFARGAAALFAVVLPLGMFVAAQIKGDGRNLTQLPTVSRLDVVVLRTDTPPQAAPSVRRGDWRINTWTGVVDGHHIAWVGGRRPHLDGQADADRVLILLPPPSDTDSPARWLALADRVEPRATPTYALLDRPTRAQLGVWQAPLSGPTGRAGSAMALSALPGGPTTPEPTLGLLAAMQSPTAAADLALAVAHRPILLFDRGEPVPHPLNVDALFDHGLFSGCQVGQKLVELCTRLDRADELGSNYDHLAFDTRAVADSGVENTIYVHVTHVAPDRPTGAGEIDLDYWWYLADNPAHSGDGAFCGPGFTLGGVTCFDHQSDWEGVTVILDARHPAKPPVAVNYAQHDGTVRYSWSVLDSLWNRTKKSAPRAAALFAVPDEQGIRPLVYSARGTHASYPVYCGGTSCPRTALPQFAGKDILRETRMTAVSRGPASPIGDAPAPASRCSPRAATGRRPRAGTPGAADGGRPTASSASCALRRIRRTRPASNSATSIPPARARPTTWARPV